MTKPVTVDTELLDFCETERQKEIIDAVLKYQSTRDASEKLNLSQRNVQRCILNVKKRAALKGWAPKHDMTKTCPDPYIVKGVSTLYNKDGEPVSQWVKTTLDEEKLNQYLEGIVEASLAEIKPIKIPKYQQRVSDSNTLTVYPIADLHIGLKSWMAETGNDYDLEIAEKVLKQVFTKLIERAPNSKQCLVAGLGDFLHSDTLDNETSRSGNTLDVDSRYAKMYGVAMKLFRFVIETAATKHKHVYVINCTGNHDDLGALTLSIALSNIYEHSKRIHVLHSPSPRQYFLFGQNLIGCTHGYECAAKDLPLVMAAEKSCAWGACKYRYWLTGHIHQDKVIESGSCKVESFRTITGKDAWTNSKGYFSGRDLKAIVYHKDFGEIERYTIAADPDMYRK